MPSKFVPGLESHALPCVITDYDGTTSVTIQYSGFKTVSCSNPTTGGDRDLPHPWHYTVNTHRVPQGTKTYLNTYPTARYRTEQGVISYPGVDYTLDFQDTGLARTKCLAKVIQTLKSSELNLATTLGEGRETYNMLADIVKSARRMRRKLKTGRARGIVKAMRKRSRDTNKPQPDWRKPLAAIGGAELYYALGVGPLIADVNAFVEHASKGLTDTLVIPFRERASAVQQFSAETTHVTEGLTVTQKETLEVSERTMMAGYFVIGDLHSFENWRAGLNTRPSLLWELLTLSFLIDYFLNVGQFIELWEATALSNGYTIKEAYQTDTSFVARSIKFDGFHKPSGSGVFLQSVDAVQGNETRSFNRILLGGTLPLPDLPRLKLPKAASQLLNIASLLSQLLK